MFSDCVSVLSFCDTFFLVVYGGVNGLALYADPIFPGVLLSGDSRTLSFVISVLQNIYITLFLGANI